MCLRYWTVLGPILKPKMATKSNQNRYKLEKQFEAFRKKARRHFESVLGRFKKRVMAKIGSAWRNVRGRWGGYRRGTIAKPAGRTGQEPRRMQDLSKT